MIIFYIPALTNQQAATSDIILVKPTLSSSGVYDFRRKGRVALPIVPIVINLIQFHRPYILEQTRKPTVPNKHT